ncbi:DUF3822 family protein [Urechidicola vernalis]|uniref:DUF3822 family protein n=1 Tax=Urechidicola vernalis TaxID=3075600 RepID=A0ABU2Y2R4_9FLAO|nr:DUF3822 family protein [Urechidicola sp. P050]MDT0552075.1 DUF3822 family protein [Urechidicola sp. P050]
MHTKILSILLRSDGFSFCITTDSEQNAKIKEFDFEKEISPSEQITKLSTLFEKEDFLQEEFESIEVIHSNNLSTLVPKPFFKEKDLASYLKYNIKLLQNDFIAYDPICNGEIMNVYIPFVHLNNFFFDKFGTFEYKHSSTVLIDSLIKANAQNEETIFSVHVGSNQFQIVVLQRKKLLFYNSFNFRTKEDFIYYILFTAEQLELNPETFKLVLYGRITKDSELYKIVYDYVRNVSFHPQNDFHFILSNN